MVDYVSWMFRLDFCTLWYILRTKLRLEKLRVQWDIHARNYEEKIKEMGKTRWVNKCWREKREEEWKDLMIKKEKNIKTEMDEESRRLMEWQKRRGI